MEYVNLALPSALAHLEVVLSVCTQRDAWIVRIYKSSYLCLAVYLYRPIITNEPLRRFDWNYDWRTRPNHRNVIKSVIKKISKINMCNVTLLQLDWYFKAVTKPWKVCLILVLRDLSSEYFIIFILEACRVKCPQITNT